MQYPRKSKSNIKYQIPNRFWQPCMHVCYRPHPSVWIGAIAFRQVPTAKTNLKDEPFFIPDLNCSRFYHIQPCQFCPAEPFYTAKIAKPQKFCQILHLISWVYPAMDYITLKNLRGNSIVMCQVFINSQWPDFTAYMYLKCMRQTK